MGITLLILLMFVFLALNGGRGRGASQTASLTSVDDYTGSEFETFVARVLEKRGFRVIEKGGSGDFGADLILEASVDRILVEVKRRKAGSSVGPSVVREALGAVQYHDCDRAMVVTNVEFTRAAEKQARGSEIVLVGREKLGEWMEMVGMNQRKEVA